MPLEGALQFSIFFSALFQIRTRSLSLPHMRFVECSATRANFGGFAPANYRQLAERTDDDGVSGEAAAGLTDVGPACISLS